MTQRPHLLVPAGAETWSNGRLAAFLVWTGGWAFVTVGAATYLTDGHSFALRVVAWLVALVLGVLVAVLSISRAPRRPARVDAPPTAAPLVEQLERGRRVRERVSRAAAIEPLIATIDQWIRETCDVLRQFAPAEEAYFAHDALPSDVTWPSKLEDAIRMTHSGRLDRHLARLEEIVVRPQR